MRIDSISLLEGSDVTNLVVKNGTAFPTNPDAGELFFRTDGANQGLYVFDGTVWNRHIKYTDSVTTFLPDIISANTYRSVTVNSKGLVTAGTNPTTLAGHGITDAQPLSTLLTNFAALSGTSGFPRKTGAATWTLDTATYLTANQTITVSGDAAGSGTTAITLTFPNIATAGTYRSVTINAKGQVTSGTNPTTLAGYGITDAQLLDADLTAIGALAGTSGLLRKTAANTWSLDTTSFLSGNQTITVSGDATGSGTTSIAMTLATVNSNVGSFGSATQVPTFTVNAKGLVTAASNTTIALPTSAITSGTFLDGRIASTNVTQHQASLTILESQITDGTVLARNAGNETITGTWSFSNPVTVAAPTADGHAATKLYVDTVAQGIITKPAVEIATTANLTATYNNGTAGVGATLSGTGAFPAIDGVTLTSTTPGFNGVLVKNQTAALQNGRYNLTTASPNWVLTRCGLCDQSSEIPGAYVFVKTGTVGAGTGWVQTVTNPSTFTIGTDSISVTQFSGTGTYTAGTGLTLSSTQFSITNTGVTASTYRSVTVNAQGQVTAGSNPTTLAGYGITDAQPLTTILTSIAAVATNGIYVRTGATTATARSIAVSGTGLSITNADGVAGNPTVTSNATSANTISTIVARDGSGNFTAGTITATAFSGSGASLTALNAGNISTGTLAVGRGGTGAITLTGYLVGNGTSAFTAVSTIPGTAITGNITGNAANVTGTVAVANGGTGVATITGYVKGNGTAVMTGSATIPVADLTGTLPVANGGTGAATLTGYVIGNGTGAMTASATIPGSAITGNITGNAANVTGTVLVSSGGTGATNAEAACTNLGAPRIGPTTPKTGDIQVVGSVISIYAGGAWRQVFPAVYS